MDTAYKRGVADQRQANRFRYHPEDRGFYEVYFVEVQDPGHRSGLWVRYTICAPKSAQKETVAQLWAMYFDREEPSKCAALQKTIPIQEAKLGPNSFQIGDAGIDASGCRGKIQASGQDIEWDLKWNEDELLIPFPYEWMYRASFPKTKFYSPHWDARINGHYKANEKEWSCADAPGQQTHIWGVEHAHRWAWCHVNTFEDAPGVVVEGLHAQIQVGGLAIPRFAFLGVRYQDETHVFNQVHQLLFTNQSRFKATQNSTKFYPPGKWILQSETEELRFRCELSGNIEHYIGVTYRDTQGQELFCNHNKLTTAQLEVFQRNEYGDWIPSETLTSHSGALEFVGRCPDPRIPVLIQ